MSVDSIHRHSENPRKGNTEAIAHSIQSNGFYGALVIQKSTRNILAGNHRYDAAKSEGLKEIPAIVLDCTDAEAKRILLVDNRLNDTATYDDQALAEILTSIQADAGTLEGTGYDQAAFDTIVKAAGDAVLALAPKEEKALNTGAKLTNGFEYRLIVDCEGEDHQTELLERFESEGLKVRPLIS